MPDQANQTYIEWLKLAEESAAKGNYEMAANNMRRVTHCFGLSGDISRQKEFVGKTGLYCQLAAEKLLNSGQFVGALPLYIKASDCYKETEDRSSANECDVMIQKIYGILRRNGFIDFQESSLGLKCFADYFRLREEMGKATECYEAAANIARKEGKIMLAGGLNRDAGDCSLLLKDVLGAATYYVSAADDYFEAGKHFEAVWHYNCSTFLLISKNRFDEALVLARKARNACIAGNIHVLLDRLSKACELLSKREHFAAEEEWRGIKGKFKRDYAELIDQCFQKAKESEF